MGYTKIETSKNVVQLAYANGALYRRDQNGSIWKWNNIRPHGDNWTSVCGPDNLTAITGTKDFLYKLHTDGKFFRFLGHNNEWIQVHDYGHIRDAIASDDRYYYILADGSVAGDDIMQPLQTYAQLKKLYESLQAREQQDRSEISRLQAIKAEDDRTIQQLRAVAAQDANKERSLQETIATLQNNLVAAQAAEAKLAADLDAEKKKEHDEWKKAQEHDAEDHKAIDKAHILNVELQKKLDDLNKEILGTVIPGLQKTVEGLKNDIVGHEALIDGLKKHQV